MTEIVSRADIGVAAPGNRPKLPKVSEVLVHYPGVKGYHDPAKDWDYARSVVRYASNAGKPYEYNAMIGLGGTIFEMAGDRVAAHCKNWNTNSYGILMLSGIGVGLTREQIISYQWLIGVLKWVQQIEPDAVALPHYARRSTSCPGLMLADPPGVKIPSPTGEGRAGLLNGFLRI